MSDLKTTMFKRISWLNLFSQQEIAEIELLLTGDEEVIGILTGLYSGGIATLCLTSKRILLVDKKWIKLQYEDFRYENINEVDYFQQLLLASVKFIFGGRELLFRTWYKKELRLLTEIVQSKMFEANAEPQSATQGTNGPRANEQHLLGRIEKWRKVTEFIYSLELVAREQSRSR